MTGRTRTFGKMGKDADRMFNTARSWLDQEWTAGADWADGLSIEELVNVWGVLLDDKAQPNEFRVHVLGMPDRGLAIARRLLKTALCEALHRVHERERGVKHDGQA